MKPLISVIMPIYNGANVLGESLGNLLNQTYENMEIILVDDASTDDTRRIMEAAAEQYPEQVRLLFQEQNAGPGAARNLGIEAARGEYIGFVDADDRVDVTMYEKLYELITSENADIADCAFYQESKDKASLHFSPECCGDLDARKRSDLIAGGGFAVTKLFARDIFMATGLRYRPDYVLEDMDLVMLAICCAGRVAGTDEVLYIYRDRGGSQSKESDPGKYIMACASAIGAIYQRVGALEEYDGISSACEYAMLTLYSNGINMCLYQMKEYPERSEIFRPMIDVLRQLRMACIKKELKANPYVRKKMDKADIEVINAVDSGKIMV